MNIDNALGLLHQKLAAIKGHWMLIGTCSLYVSGYPVKPNHIDILTDKATAKEIEAVLFDIKIDSQVKPNEKFRSVFSQYKLHGVNIEVMGGLEVNTPQGWVLLNDKIANTQQVLFKNQAFTVPAKQEQLIIYTLFGRDKDKAALQMLVN